jgi:hypothetical protein
LRLPVYNDCSDEMIASSRTSLALAFSERNQEFCDDLKYPFSTCDEVLVTFANCNKHSVSSSFH